MNSSHLAAAATELPVIETEVANIGQSQSEISNHAGPSGSPKYGNGTKDIELMDMDAVVGREAGERDPLLLRERMVDDDQIEGLRQSVPAGNNFVATTDPAQPEERQEDSELL